jgi:hypothetical protein
MTPETARETARDDLAFMRALVSGEDGWSRQFAKVYTAAGACYAVQMAGHVGQHLNLLPGAGPIALAIGWLPSVVFLAILMVIVRRRTTMPNAATARATGAIFTSVGLANLMLCLSIGSVALRLHSLTIWLIYPCVVMILQGLAWMAAAMLRRRGWMTVVAIGWFAVGFAMAWFIDDMTGFIVAATVGIICFMLVPGLYLLRQGGREV